MAEKTIETVEMVDGRVYLTTDNWETVYVKRNGKMRRVTDKKEADRARLFAIAQAHGGSG